jgi:DNA-binding transcriptional MerR regulator
MLKVGELAALANLTVRTLHHYDDIGLLRPSARSDAGYRLYSRDDVARLHQIQALRAFGMGLADVGLALDSPAGAPLAVVERQLAALEQRMQETARMRDQLLLLRTQLTSGAAPDLSTWLTTLENMKMYERYFTQDELARLPLAGDAAQAEWRALVGQASGLMQSGVAPDTDAAMTFALRWLHTFERDTGGDAAFMARLNVMALREEDGVGMPAEVLDYVLAALAALKRATWARYLRPEVIARMQAHHATRGREWRRSSNGRTPRWGSTRRPAVRWRAHWRASGWTCSTTWSVPTRPTCRPSARPPPPNRCCAWVPGSANRCWPGCGARWPRRKASLKPRPTPGGRAAPRASRRCRRRPLPHGRGAWRPRGRRPRRTALRSGA